MPLFTVLLLQAPAVLEFLGPGSVGGGVYGVEAEGGHSAAGPWVWEDIAVGREKTLGSLL